MLKQPGAATRRAAGICLAMQLGKAEHGLAEQVGVGVRELVVVRIARRVLQPEIGADVDDPQALGEQLGDDLQRGAGGQPAQRDLALRGNGLHVEGPQYLVQLGEVGVHRVHRLARIALGMQVSEPHLGMQLQQSNEFDAAVAGGAEKGDVHHTTHPP